MASKCSVIRAAEIAREAKKMQIEAHKEQLKTFQEEYKLLVQAVKDEKEHFKSGKASAGPRLYKDNAMNRKLGRVDKPIPSKKKAKNVIDYVDVDNGASNDASNGASNDASNDLAKETKATTLRVYKDNAANRKLGRVGKPIPSRKGKNKSKKEESKALVVAELPKAVAKAAELEEVKESDELGLEPPTSDSYSETSDDEGF